jgi:hypothetical protein
MHQPQLVVLYDFLHQQEQEKMVVTYHSHQTYLLLQYQHLQWQDLLDLRQEEQAPEAHQLLLHHLVRLLELLLHHLVLPLVLL